MMKIESNKELVAEIKKYMYLYDYTVKDCADKKKVTRQALYKFFSGESNPRFDSIMAIIDALDAEIWIEIKHKNNTENK